MVFSFAPPALQVFEICRACEVITDQSLGWDGLIKLYLKKKRMEKSFHHKSQDINCTVVAKEEVLGAASSEQKTREELMSPWNNCSSINPRIFYIQSAGNFL